MPARPELIHPDEASTEAAMGRALAGMAAGTEGPANPPRILLHRRARGLPRALG